MNTNYKIEYKTTIQASKEKVWEALTNPEIVKQYFFGTELISSWEVGSDIIYQGEWDGKKYKDGGKILEYIHNQKLAYSYLSSWSNMEDSPENYLWIGFEVKTVQDKTELTITQSNYTQELAKHSEENWNSIINEMKKIIE
jgi:uncharacterized protein YndB with AHSA1/START domain